MTRRAMTWLYGPRRPRGIPGLGGDRIRPFVINATALEALRVYMEKMGVGGDPATIEVGGRVTDLDSLVQIHPVRLKNVTVSNSQFRLDIYPGYPPTLSVAEGTAFDTIHEEIERLSRHRMHLRRLLAVIPWLLPLLAGGAFSFAVESGADAVLTVTSVTVLLMALVLAWTTSRKIWEREANRYPDTRVDPFRWVDVLERRAKLRYAAIGFATALLVAVAGAVAAAAFTPIFDEIVTIQQSKP